MNWTYKHRLPAPYEYHIDGFISETEGELYDLLKSAMKDCPYQSLVFPIAIRGGKFRLDHWDLIRIEEHARWYWQGGENRFLKRLADLLASQSKESA